MKVKNMIGRTGREVPNQFIISDGCSTYFQSYSSIIARETYGDNGRMVTLDETYWDYSATTRKYRNQFLGEDSSTIKRKIKSGEYRLANLN